MRLPCEMRGIQLAQSTPKTAHPHRRDFEYLHPVESRLPHATDRAEGAPAMTETSVADARDQLVGSMKAVIADAEELLKATAGATGDRVSAIRARAEETVRSARAKLADLDDAVIDQAKEAARTADEYVRKHPWGAVGIAAVAGIVVGVLISRR